MKTLFSTDVFARGGVGGSTQWVKPVGLKLAGAPVPDLRYSSQPKPTALRAAPSEAVPGTAGHMALGAVAPTPVGYARRRRMGQFGDIDLDDLGDLIAELPEELAKSFSERLDECFSLLTAGKIGDAAACGQNLYNEIQAARRGETGEPIAQTPPSPRPQPAPSEFPWIPVAIGVAGVGILVYLIARRKTA